VVCEKPGPFKTVSKQKQIKLRFIGASETSCPQPRLPEFSPEIGASSMRFEAGAFINCVDFLRRLERLALDETKAGERKDTPAEAIICRPEQTIKPSSPKA
jgi:hypothetical protein